MLIALCVEKEEERKRGREEEKQRNREREGERDCCNHADAATKAATGGDKALLCQHNEIVICFHDKSITATKKKSALFHGILVSLHSANVRISRQSAQQHRHTHAFKHKKVRTTRMEDYYIISVENMEHVM